MANCGSLDDAIAAEATGADILGTALLLDTPVNVPAPTGPTWPSSPRSRTRADSRWSPRDASTRPLRPPRLETPGHSPSASAPPSPTHQHHRMVRRRDRSPLMDVIIDTADSIGDLVAEEISQLLRTKSDAVLGLATGSSPLRIYDALADRSSRGEVTFAHASAFTLDGCVELPDGHPCSYRTVIHEDFVARVNFQPGTVDSPDGAAADLHTECARYERRIADAGGIDFQILGIGTDGHIAFNEPGSSFASARTWELWRCRPVGRCALLRRRHRCCSSPLPHPGAWDDPRRTSDRSRRHR